MFITTNTTINRYTLPRPIKYADIDICINLSTTIRQAPMLPGNKFRVLGVRLLPCLCQVLVLALDSPNPEVEGKIK